MGSRVSMSSLTLTNFRSVTMAACTGSRKRFWSPYTASSRSDSSRMPTMRPSLTTGSCETSYSFMRV
ncbi:hypothetical protein D3C83_136660 [compost metagenome]